MKIWIGNHYFSEKEKPELAEEIRDIVGDDNYDNVGLIGFLPDSYEGKLRVKTLDNVSEIIDHGSTETLAYKAETCGDTVNWVRGSRPCD
jgi:hypothetical protein